MDQNPAMIRTGVFLLLMALAGCGGKERTEVQDDGSYTYEKLSARFSTITPPYSLSDTGFLNNKDTTTVRFAEFGAFIPDSIKTKIFGKNARPKYVAMVQLKPSEETSLYLVKAVSGSKKAALLLAFHQGEHKGLVPFLVPDKDASTSQLTSIDKNYVITRQVIQRKAGQPQREGKEVLEFDAASGTFSLILTNPLFIENAEIINPIDTFARTHKLAGDYVKDKRNFISIRDGRYDNQLQVFIHIDKKNDCSGELKGDILLTSPTTAIYRQQGDPCVLSLRFTGSSVRVQEDEGCGSHRGLDCVFDGSYPKKKEAKPKKTNSKKR